MTQGEGAVKVLGKFFFTLWIIGMQGTCPPLYLCIRVWRGGQGVRSSAADSAASSRGSASTTPAASISTYVTLAPAPNSAAASRSQTRLA